MNKTTLVTGSLGQDRLNYLNEYLDNYFKTKSDQITIYDSTYGFIKYSHYSNCNYFSVDSTISFIDYLKTIKDRNSENKMYLILEAYAGLFYSKSNLEIIEDILLNKDKYNLEILMSSRHIDFIPEKLIGLFTDKITFKEEVTLLANTK